MYKSPITLLIENAEKQLRQAQEQSEQTIYQCVNSFGVAVDKEELIKALKYDRDQYSRGYKDGANEVLDKIRAEIQRLRGCSCSCSDGIIDDVEDILDKYKAESEE